MVNGLTGFKCNNCAAAFFSFFLCSNIFNIDHIHPLPDTKTAALPTVLDPITK